MAIPATISDLLKLSQAQFRVYDLGRRISKITKKQFEKIELNQQPYPYPSQGHAFFAISFWQKRAEPYLWFVKLPLDERGLLNQGARNHFIAIIIEALGSDLTVDPTEKQQELLAGNPYHFTPSQYKLAALNSLIKVERKQSASIYYEHCQLYFSGKLGWNEWQGVGFQGIMDFCARLAEADNEPILIQSLPHIPEPVLLPLCTALENHSLSNALIAELIILYHRAEEQKATNRQQHMLRALASSCHASQIKQLIAKLFTQQLNDELLIVIAGRCWETLTEAELMSGYLEQLVAADTDALFFEIFKDLVAIPTLRPVIFQCMRQESRSDALAAAIGRLFNQVTQ